MKNTEYGTRTPSVTLVDGDNANGLASMLANVIEQNLKDPKKAGRIRRLVASIIVEITDMDVAITMTFDRGQVAISNGKTCERPDAYMGADFQTLAAVAARQKSALKAMREKRLRVKGLFKLLKVQSLIMVPE